MKKIKIILFMLMFIVCGVLSVACNEVKYYEVTLDSQNGTSPSSMGNWANGSTLEIPNEPTKNGFIFDGWYKEQACVREWDFANDTVTSKITLYAKWTGVFGKLTIAPGVAQEDYYDNIGGVIEYSGSVIYALKTGSALPSNLVLSQNGEISGMIETGIGEVNFDVIATADNNKKAEASFSLTIINGEIGLPKLDVPENIRFASAVVGDAILLWDEVEGAYAYRININDELFLSETTSFSFKDNGLALGNTYSIKIRALAGYIFNSHSSWSEEEILIAKSKLAIPTNSYVSVWNNIPVFYWKKVECADYYQVTVIKEVGISWTYISTHKVQGEELFDQLYMDISFITNIGSYFFQIRACSDNESFVSSDLVTFENCRYLIEKLSFEVAKNPYATINERVIDCKYLNSDSISSSSEFVMEYEIIIDDGEIQKLSVPISKGSPHWLNLNNFIPPISGSYNIKIRAISDGRYHVYSLNSLKDARAIMYLDSDWIEFTYIV